MQTEQKITVFIPHIDEITWMGGKQYYDNLVHLVTSNYPNVSFCETSINHASFFPKKNSLTNRIRRKISGLSYLEEYQKNFQNYYLKKAGETIPVIFTNEVLTKTGIIPYIFWIPDFQFLHLKEYATTNHIKICEDDSRKGATLADKVMLSSQDAFKDFSQFLPEFISKAQVVPFAKKISPSFLNQKATIVIGKYHLPDAFFYVPNQFWKHKNHMVVLDALLFLKEKGLKFTVVFSGHTNDFRNQNYFDGLLSKIAEQNIREQVFILGMIPFADVVSLIRESVAVINPSRFEGWNTAVEEVKSIGKSLLLSDIAVHREQLEDDGKFFNPDKPEELAELMIKTLYNWKNDKKYIGEESAIKKYGILEKKFADNFYQLLSVSAKIIRINKLKFF